MNMKINRNLAETTRLREQARRILRDHSFDSALTEFNRGEFSLDTLLEELHIYHAELLIQQDALRESQEANELALARFARLYFDLPLPAILVSWNGRVKETNAAAAAVLALNRQLFTHLANPHHVAVLEAALHQARMTGKAECPEISLRGVGESLLIADLTLTRLPGAASVDGELICTIVDQTERIAREARYRQLTAIMSDIAYSCLNTADDSFRIDWMTGSIETLTGYSLNEILARGCWRFLLVPEDLDAFDARLSQLMAGETFSSELCLRHRDGSLRWVRATTECLLEPGQPHLRRLYGGLVNITEHKARASEIQRLALVVEQSPSIVLITDMRGSIEYVNQHFCDITGYSRQDVHGQPVERLRSDATPAATEAEMWQTIQRGQTWRGEFQNRKKSGEIYWEQALITPLRNEQGVISHFVKLAEDVSEKRTLSAQLSYVIHYDPLTGLPNRTLMRESIDRALIRAARETHGLAVLSIDLDNLKFVNDSLGHATGDRLLRAVAQRLRNLLGEEDTLARLGGDNFVLLVGQLRQVREVVALADRIQAVLDEPIILDDGSARITASAGIALYPEDALTTDELISHADAALHIAKTDGRHTYRFYTPALNQQLMEQFQLEQALRQALERDELILHYQPRVDIETGQILSLEALARWDHPDWGPVSPTRFIPVAEATGLILQLGPSVLRQACQQIQRWRSDGVPVVPVAVNLSANELYQDDLARQIEDIVAAAGVAPADLEFEITESAAMRSIDQAVAILSTLRDRGFSLSIDDFGTGYASLSYLNRLPMQALKIDRSFLADIDGDLNHQTQSAAIIKAIIGLGSNLGLHIIAEGVETQAQRTFLLNHDCHVAQGYLFARPLPADAIEPLLRAGKVSVSDASSAAHQNLPDTIQK
jgi:diguanylate cyclase (GGDEF)-like protein/PAS domain S-box-containing protein